MANKDKEYLFVYGTLKKDIGNDMYHLLAKHAGFVGDTTWNGKLYIVEDYPGAVPSDDPSDIVYGELYLLNDPDNILPSLDNYEECSDKFPEPKLFKRIPKLFKRIKDDVGLDNGDIVSACIYIYNMPVDNLMQIKSGNFTRE